MNVRQRMRLVLAALLLLRVATGRAGEVVVQTVDGRELAGVRLAGESPVRVRDFTRNILLSPAVVRRLRPRPDSPLPPVYPLNQELAAFKPKKGKIGPVARDWGRLGAFDAAGHARWQLTDFKLGPVSFRVVIVRLTPRVYEFAGVEYEVWKSFPYASLGWLGRRLVLGQVEERDRESVLKALRFLRLAGDFDGASSLLERGLLPPAIAKRERRLFTLARLRAGFARLVTLEASDDWPAAVQAAGRLRAHLARLGGATPQSRQAVPGLAAALERCRARQRLGNEVNARVQALLPGSARVSLLKVPHLAWLPSPPAPELVQRLRLCWPQAPQPWTRALPKEAAACREVAASALELAQAVAMFFAAGDPGRARELGARLRASKLPFALKLAILRHATALGNPPAVAWHRVSYKHPRSGEEYHYYVQVPPGYDPDVPTPVLLALHGQVSKADIMVQFWGKVAAAQRLLLISPEYIYGRKWGYRYSRAEHEAVLGALWHAAGEFNIDRDRVYLQGHSQGGHAAWDIGLCHAGEFAGVLPVIGVAPPAGKLLENALDTSFYIVDGEKDGAAPKYNRRSITELARMRAHAVYVEYIGRGHEAFFEEMPAMAAWMRARCRPRGPAQVHLAAARSCSRRRAWLEVMRTRKRLPSRLASREVRVQVSATVKDNEFRIKSRGVEELRLYLCPELVDWQRRLRVRINGRLRLQRKLQPDWSYALKSSMERRDRQRLFLGAISVRCR